jgi:hypothetical protein
MIQLVWTLLSAFLGIQISLITGSQQLGFAVYILHFFVGFILSEIDGVRELFELLKTFYFDSARDNIELHKGQQNINNNNQEFNVLTQKILTNYGERLDRLEKNRG